MVFDVFISVFQGKFLLQFGLKLKYVFDKFMRTCQSSFRNFCVLTYNQSKTSKYLKTNAGKILEKQILKKKCWKTFYHAARFM